jgi:hypothetical protein
LGEPQRGSALRAGHADELIDNLRALLLDIDRDPAIDRPFTWPGQAKQTSIRDVMYNFGTAGLVRREGPPARLVLTEEARRFLESGDPTYLVAVLHCNVRFIGEALASLGGRYFACRAEPVRDR